MAKNLSRKFATMSEDERRRFALPPHDRVHRDGGRDARERGEHLEDRAEDDPRSAPPLPTM